METTRPKTESAAAPGAYEGLARRYRPQSFADVIGQGHVVRTLSRAIEEGRWAAAYLFIGGRGLGKTTMARILAKSINCEKGPTAHPCGVCSHCRNIAAGRDIDVVEIDAASNTGVDNVRDVIIQAASTAAARSRCKIFIIDETHMLSGPAFNALLKTIEEPPSHVLFVLATTDGHRVPTTIRSRCQRFDFRPVAVEELGARLRLIAEKESIAIDDESIAIITTHAEGGVRDALSALDLVRAFAADRITIKETEEALGVIPRLMIEALLDAIASGEADTAIERLADLEHAGADPGEVMRGLLLGLRAAFLADLRGRTGAFTRGRLIRSIEALLASLERQRHSRFPWIELETLVGRLALLGDEETSLKELYNRLLLLERGETPPAVSVERPAAGPVRRTEPVAAKEEEKAAFPVRERPTPPPAAPSPPTAPAKKASTETNDEIEKLKRIFKSSKIEVVS